MGLAEGILFYGTLAVFALVVGALVSGFALVIHMAIEATDDYRRNRDW